MTASSPSPAASSQVTAPTTKPCSTNAGSRFGKCSVAGISFPGMVPNIDVSSTEKPDSLLCGTNLSPLMAKTTSTVVFNREFYITVIGTSSTDVKGANGFKLNFQQTCQ